MNKIIINTKSFKGIAASLICANPLDIISDLRQLIKANVDYIHFDVMDGHFVPRYGLYPEILSSVIKELHFQNKQIPVDVHMMVENPEDYIDVFAKAGATYFCVHYEACPQLHRTIKRINDAGMKAGVALNYHTAPYVLEYVLQDIHMIVLMAINPGIVGHKMIPEIYEKITDTHNFLRTIRHKEILIEIDGGVTFESALNMYKAGADVLVCGTGTIFRPQEDSIVNKTNQFRELFK